MSARGKIPGYWVDNAPHYKYIGGIDNYDVWALGVPRAKVKGAWDCLIFDTHRISIFGDYAEPETQLDIYRSNRPNIRSIQDHALRDVEYKFSPERIATIGAMILCFAPYLITNSVRPKFKYLHDMLGETLTNA